MHKTLIQLSQTMVVFAFVEITSADVQSCQLVGIPLFQKHRYFERVRYRVGRIELGRVDGYCLGQQGVRP